MREISTLFSIFITFIILINDKRICISLIIPSTFTSWNNCNKQIEMMVCKSSELPKEVIIVISENKNNSNMEYITFCKYHLKLYFRNAIHNSASNRNYGFSFSTCGYISFFDADDVMFSNRIKILRYIVTHYPLYDIIIHKETRIISKNKYRKVLNKNINHYFYLNSSYITYLHRKYTATTNKTILGCCIYLPESNISVANGWITVKRSVFLIEKYNELSLYRRAEDSEYNSRIILKGYNALILKLILGFYSKRNNCNYYLQRIY